MSTKPIPVVLFTYSRPKHLNRVLTCLRENEVPLILACSDGAKWKSDAAAVEETRRLLRAVDWAEVHLIERPENLGLGRNILTGVSAVAACYAAFIVWEDDLVCVPGTYAWLCAALNRYAKDERVMSVTGWTHPRVTPCGIGDTPYFDGRAECWSWGTWARAWRGMEGETALQKMREFRKRTGRSFASYGYDLPQMAQDEQARNIWAVRWLYHHLQHGGLCLRPPWSLVEHIGFDETATNANSGEKLWRDVLPENAPPVSVQWPASCEARECAARWRSVYPSRRFWPRLFRACLKRFSLHA